MENSTRKPRHYRVSLTPTELARILGALAETIEEQRHQCTRSERARLVHLHTRLGAVLGLDQPDYQTTSQGSVVAARNPAQVIAPGLAGMLLHMGARHG